MMMSESSSSPMSAICSNSITETAAAAGVSVAMRMSELMNTRRFPKACCNYPHVQTQVFCFVFPVLQQ